MTPTSARDLRFMRRMVAMILTGCALTLAGALIDPVRQLRKQH